MAICGGFRKPGTVEHGLFRAWADVHNRFPKLLPLMVLQGKAEQHVPFARQMFWQAVGRALRQLGHSEAADLCDVLRGFGEAVDLGGLSDETRDQLMLDVIIYFGSDPAAGEAGLAAAFYPPRSHYRGLPWQTVEGLLITASTRLHLRGAIGTFHPRICTTDKTESLFSRYPAATIRIFTCTTKTLAAEWQKGLKEGRSRCWHVR